MYSFKIIASGVVRWLVAVGILPALSSIPERVLAELQEKRCQ